MQNSRKFLLFLLCCCGSLAYGQTKSTLKPLVETKFEYQIYKEGFDSVSADWPTLSNSENLLLVQDGEYILQRKSKLSPFAAMGDLKQQPESFRLVTSLKLVKSSIEEGSLGFIFMAQEGGTGGFIFEINKLQQYRLRQLTPSGYAYMTGNSKDGGWMKSQLLKPVNFANLVELRTHDKKYDLYLNNTLLLSFTEIAYKSGSTGFIIGPGTMGKVDFVYLFTNEKPADGNIVGNNPDASTGEADVIALAESIIELKTQLNKAQAENDQLKERIESFKGSEKETVKLKADYDARIATLEKQLFQRRLSFDSLILINQDLLKYKEMVKGNDGGDLVITLSKNLKAEKLKSDELMKQNQAMKDSIQVLNALLKNPNGKTSGAGNSNSKPANNNDKVFILPKEN
ncbi:MAG: hypothetical protein KBB64_10865 [Bacteroidia bacterium]|nr:hypothetical protein [Bacteroidia bacterium]